VRRSADGTSNSLIAEAKRGQTSHDLVIEVLGRAQDARVDSYR
jgi:hypothetical protein